MNMETYQSALPSVSMFQLSCWISCLRTTLKSRCSYHLLIFSNIIKTYTLSLHYNCALFLRALFHQLVSLAISLFFIILLKNNLTEIIPPGVPQLPRGSAKEEATML